MISRACSAILFLVGVAADFADSGVALSRVIRLSEMAFNEDLSSGPCVPDKAKNIECDMNGNQCSLCGRPLPGRGYDGKAVYSSTITPGTTIHAPDYILRDDCGNHTTYNVPPLRKLEVSLTPVTWFNQQPSQAAFPGWTNAWCETNGQKVCVDAVTNRDYMFQPKTYDIPRGFTFDFYYCKYNGWLSAESRAIVTRGFDAMHNDTVGFCAERNREFPLASITSVSMQEYYLPGLLGPQHRPTPEQARYLGAWTCAMGGADGESTGSGCDQAYCHYTYGELDPAAGASKAFCMYEECEGWDQMTGMPVGDYATLAQLVAPPAGALYV